MGVPVGGVEMVIRFLVLKGQTNTQPKTNKLQALNC